MRKNARTTYPELVAALDKLGLSDRAVEREAGVPQAFVSKLRRGECGSAKAAASVAKLMEFLEGKGLAPAVSDTSSARPSPAAAKAPYEIPEELAKLVDEADSHEAIGRALKETAHLITRGKLDRFTGAAIQSLLESRAVALDRETKEQSRMDSGKPVRIHVVYRNDFRGAPACKTCHGTGRENAGRSTA